VGFVSVVKASKDVSLGRVTTASKSIGFFSAKKRNKGKKHQEIKQENEQETELLSNFTKPLNTISVQSLRAAMEALTMNQKPAKTPEEALTKSYQFWNTQPVPKMGKAWFA
jgi:glycylpeptide N-tetradecanoyltransferase